ncbi:tyrosine-type recombinase/integrase [Pseudanabaena sp. PCC 6802]|uniref:tyrosine-type recombinase/integrase n=1 Tax=Pseudanabaena sp. PCC 6802 TaxID=118173 RepID=UPI00034D7C6E|nr:tyrosine-type recombinase/integrase [Pseudanabaena sp. PCC 6802]
MAKGTVALETFKDRLRLRWGYAGKRYCLYIGLPDTKVNRFAAEGKARQIELDIASGNFDTTLKKYKTDRQVQRSQLKTVELFEKFMQEKAKSVYQRSLEKYKATLGYLRQYFKEKQADAISVALAEQFLEWLCSKISPVTAKERLTLINACWEWGINEEIIENNPWNDLVARVKIPPKQKSKPFTREEIQMIIEAFRSDRYYSHYADFVEFLFGTGCRTGEAVGLRWGHLSDDCSSVWIGESVSRGVRKSTKTNRARTISLTPHLQSMLLARRPENPDSDGLVFPTPHGHAIDDHNFRNRAWKTVLAGLNIDYRKPYNTRHTLISHALDLGMSPVMVAQLTGHDVATLYENYAGSVSSRPRLPELMKDRE